MKPLLVIACACLLCQCATIGVGVTYHGEHGDYSLIHTKEHGRSANWNILVGIDNKQIKPLHR